MAEISVPDRNGESNISWFGVNSPFVPMSVSALENKIDRYRFFLNISSP